jgi:hypothetical protein
VKRGRLRGFDFRWSKRRFRSDDIPDGHVWRRPWKERGVCGGLSRRLRSVLTEQIGAATRNSQPNIRVDRPPRSEATRVPASDACVRSGQTRGWAPTSPAACIVFRSSSMSCCLWINGFVGSATNTLPLDRRRSRALGSDGRSAVHASACPLPRQRRASKDHDRRQREGRRLALV